MRLFTARNIGIAIVALVMGAALIGTSATLAAPQMSMSHTTTVFSGKAVNKGTVTHSVVNGKSRLTLSDDFEVPGSPDPHWMLVDSTGKRYEMQRLKIKEDGFNKSIEIPAYIKDVKSVIIWCSWAEVVLGEASFSSPVM